MKSFAKHGFFSSGKTVNNYNRFHEETHLITIFIKLFSKQNDLLSKHSKNDMIFDFLLVGVAFYLAIPGVAAYSASSYGYSFWKWFIIAMCFPIIAHFILYFIIVRDIKRKKIITLLKKEEIQYMEHQLNQIKSEQNFISVTPRKDNNNKLIKE